MVVEHHSVFDSFFEPYRTKVQKFVHNYVVRKLVRKTFEKADHIVAVSHYTASSIKKNFGLQNVSAIWNGVDTKFFSPAPETSKGRLKFPIKLLYVGNLIPRKGADLLPKIMAKLGNKYSLEYTIGLREKVASNDAVNMHSLGKLTRMELRDAYRKADLLLFPTRFEGFGLAAVEAMACGIPVITTNCSSLPEIIDDGVTGKLCRVNGCG